MLENPFIMCHVRCNICKYNPRETSATWECLKPQPGKALQSKWNPEGHLADRKAMCLLSPTHVTYASRKHIETQQGKYALGSKRWVVIKDFEQIRSKQHTHVQ